MRLSFSLLWFDDSEEYLDSIDLDIASLKQEINSWGFSPDIRFVKTPEEFQAYSPYEAFDMIVVDQNLEGYQNGQEFIAQLRSHSVYTEVVFYSARSVSDLWNSVYEKKLEGVFVSNRNDVIIKIMKVGHQSIQKVLDLENMRGIIMAEVGELDYLLDRIITYGMQTLTETQQGRIFNKFYEKAVEQNKKDKEELENFNKGPQVANMLNLCDSYKRWSNFNRLKKEHKVLKAWGNLGNYDYDILRPRNFLAHGKPEPDDAGGYIFTHRGKEYPFNKDVSRSLRQTILSYKEQFSGILRNLDLGEA